MSFNQINITANNRTYDLKDEILSYGLDYKYSEKIFINNFELNELVFENLLWFCQKHNLGYEITQVSDSIDPTLISDSKYNLIKIDDNNYIVQIKQSRYTCYFINFYFKDNSVEINITDIRKGLYLKDNLPVFKSNDYIFETIEYYSYNNEQLITKNFQESDFLSVLSSLSKKTKVVFSEEERIRKFKFDTIRKIENNATKFLCNCVPGFYPETTFNIVGNKILNTVTENFVNASQEYRIWKYLFKNKDLIGVRKEPTIYQLFINSRIVVNINGLETKALIVKISQENYYDKTSNKLFISISDGNQIHKITKPFQRDDLFERVKEAR